MTVLRQRPGSGRRTPAADFLRSWAAIALVCGVVMSAADAVLLQRTRSFFTGGFLSVDHLSTAGEMALFAAASLIVDAGVAGLAAAAVMWLLCRRQLRAGAVALAGLLAGLGPLLAAAFVMHEIARYLGDAFDLALMFELTGRSASEIAAVASSHVISAGALLAATGGAAGGMVWLVNRYARGDRTARAPAGVLRTPLLVGLLALGTATVATAASDALENGLRRKPAGRVLWAIVEAATDFDRDGFGIGGRISDPAPFDASVFPYAADVPGNGIDENGVGGDLPADAPPYVEASLPADPWTRDPDVVLVVLESFRADMLDTIVNDEPATPVLRALAARGASSRLAFSHNGYTAQSRYHLLTGSLAGVRDDGSLVDDFRRHGYTVGYFSGQDESFGGAAYDVGFARADVSYDARQDRDRRYSTFTTAGSLAVPFSVVQERVDAFLRDQTPADRPVFLYVNFHDTHFPYSHPGVQTLTSDARLPRGRIAPGERDALWQTYVNTAANVDAAVGRLLRSVSEARGREPAVIVTADHGESLFDAAFLGHGYALDDVQTRVPLIVANLPLEIREPFGQRDLRPAIDAALRMPPSVPAEPIVEHDPDREVFQYLGTIRRPRQIALLRGGTRTIYDFRQRRVQIAGGAWQPPSALQGSDEAEFLRLVHEWERMIEARRRRGIDGN